MPRARISAGKGIEIARPGFDVDTAPPSGMAFIPGLTAGRLKYTGDVTVGPFSGFMDDRYYRGVVSFPVAFPKVPIVLVASKNGDGSSDQGGLWNNALASSEGRYLPYYTVEIYPDRFELFVLRYRVASNAPWVGLPANTWRFWVLSNPIN